MSEDVRRAPWCWLLQGWPSGPALCRRKGGGEAAAASSRWPWSPCSLPPLPPEVPSFYFPFFKSIYFLFFLSPTHTNSLHLYLSFCYDEYVTFVSLFPFPNPLVWVVIIIPLCPQALAVPSPIHPPVCANLPLQWNFSVQKPSAAPHCVSQ